MDLTKEQQEKLAACGAILREAGVELSDELLDEIAGGLLREEGASGAHGPQVRQFLTNNLEERLYGGTTWKPVRTIDELEARLREDGQSETFIQRMLELTRL